MSLADYSIIALLALGSSLSLAAAVGLVKLPDVFTRMHASTKAGTLGLGLVLLALVIAAGDSTTTIKAIATFIFIIITAPVAAHMLGRTAYRLGEDTAPNTVCDEWKDKMREVGTEEPNLPSAQEIE